MAKACGSGWNRICRDPAPAHRRACELRIPPGGQAPRSAPSRWPGGPLFLILCVIHVLFVVCCLFCLSSCFLFLLFCFAVARRSSIRRLKRRPESAEDDDLIASSPRLGSEAPAAEWKRSECDAHLRKRLDIHTNIQMKRHRNQEGQLEDSLEIKQGCSDPILKNAWGRHSFGHLTLECSSSQTSHCSLICFFWAKRHRDKISVRAAMDWKAGFARWASRTAGQPSTR